MPSEISRRIRYLIENEDLDDAVERITGMLEANDRHIKKLAEAGMAQEKEIL